MVNRVMSVSERRYLKENSMPIRLAQARLIPQDLRDHRPDHRTGIRTPLGPPDTLQMAGTGRLPSHQGKDAETPTESEG